MATTRRPWVVAVAAGLLAGPGIAGERIAVDARSEAPCCTILRGHAGDLDGIADLLEDLGRNPKAEEPVLREILRSERGYEYTVVLPRSAPEPQAAPTPGQPPIFADHALAVRLARLLVPPFT